jgi:chromosome segregation ATPase
VLKLSDNLEKRVDEHSLQIQELKDEVDFKKWKIDSLIDKIDNLTEVVQQIQLNQLKDDNDIKNRVTSIESTMTTLKWIIGIGLSGLSVVVALLGLVIS